MKTQMKAMVASAVVIALCLAAVGGVTYSWFSDTESSDVTIDTARIDIESNFTNAEKVSGPGQFSVSTVNDVALPQASLIVKNLAANCQVNLTLTTKYGTQNNVNTICKTTAKIEPTTTGGSTGLTQNDLENIYVGGLSLADQGLTIREIGTSFVVFPSTTFTQNTELTQNTCIYTPAEYSYSGEGDNTATKSFKIVFTTTAYQDDYTDTSTVTIDENDPNKGTATISSDSKIVFANTLGSFTNVKIACSAYTGNSATVTVTDTSAESTKKMNVESTYNGKVTITLTFSAGQGVKATDYRVTDSLDSEMTILAAMNTTNEAGTANLVTLTFTAASPSEFTISIPSEGSS